MASAKDPKKKPAKKAPAKKSSAKKSPAKKAVAKKTPAKKKAQPKAPAKKKPSFVVKTDTTSTNANFDIKITIPQNVTAEEVTETVKELIAPAADIAREVIEDIAEEQVAKVRRRFFSFFKKK